MKIKHARCVQVKLFNSFAQPSGGLPGICRAFFLPLGPLGQLSGPRTLNPQNLRFWLVSAGLTGGYSGLQSPSCSGFYPAKGWASCGLASQSSLKSEQLGTPRGCARDIGIVTNAGDSGSKITAAGIHSPAVHQTSL
jgi:hypothetical protein